MWFDMYADDFYEPPDFDSLCQLQSFAKQYLPDSDLAQRCADRSEAFRSRHEQTADTSGSPVMLF